MFSLIKRTPNAGIDRLINFHIKALKNSLYFISISTLLEANNNNVIGVNQNTLATDRVTFIFILIEFSRHIYPEWPTELIRILGAQIHILVHTGLSPKIRS